MQRACVCPDVRAVHVFARVCSCGAVRRAPSSAMERLMRDDHERQNRLFSGLSTACAARASGEAV